jgi:hypothetical protein
VPESNESGPKDGRVIPIEQENDDVFGFMKGKFEIVGDIVSPVTPLEDWEALKE